MRVSVMEGVETFILSQFRVFEEDKIDVMVKVLIGIQR